MQTLTSETSENSLVYSTETLERYGFQHLKANERNFHRPGAAFRHDDDVFAGDPIVLALAATSGKADGQIAERDRRKALEGTRSLFPNHKIDRVCIVPNDVAFVEVRGANGMTVYQIRPIPSVALTLRGHGDYAGQTWLAAVLSYNPWSSCRLVQIVDDSEAIGEAIWLRNKREHQAFIANMVRDALREINLSDRGKIIIAGSDIRYCQAVPYDRARANAAPPQTSYSRRGRRPVHIATSNPGSRIRRR